MQPAVELHDLVLAHFAKEHLQRQAKHAVKTKSEESEKL